MKPSVFILTALLLPVPTAFAADAKPVKVFILAGQSNMEGKAPNALLDHQAADAKTRDLFAHLRKDDRWIVRDDVFIKFLDRKGPLTVGYGSPGRTGVELEFGTAMGNHFEEPVLLIKTAWGGHSLYKLFRSPSAGYPAAEVLQKELDQAQAKVKKNNDKNKKNDPLPTLEDIKREFGASYRKMMAEVKDVMDNSGTMFPALKGKSLELAGFVWFQGWNDQYGAQDEYASNMKHFINDVRKDLKAPKLPFVIGVMGQNGSKPAAGAMLTIQKAQLSMNDVPEFQGNVKAIRTDVLVDKTAEDLFPKHRENPEQWKLVGGDFGYHYFGSAIWFNRIGKAMGDAMRELQDAPPAKVSVEPAKPTSRTERRLEGWTIRVDDRLLKGPDEELGTRALRFLEHKLSDIKVVVPADKVKKLQAVTIVLDLTHGKLGPMQYHPGAGWLKANGYSVDLAKCVHIPRAADLPTRRNINEQPWVILHELAHAYHDQVLGFDEPRVIEAYQNYKKSGRGEKALLHNGKRVKHYALTNQMEFFAEMTEAYFGANDFFPFNRAELKEGEPEIFALLAGIWESPPPQEPK